MFKLLLLLWIAVSAITLSAQAITFNLDNSHLNISFEVDHLMVSTVAGKFSRSSGQLDFDQDTGQLRDLDVKIDVSSIDTNEPDRDKHLLNPDFFNYKDKKGKVINPKYQYMNFRSTKVKYKKKRPVVIVGDLTIRGITKPVELKVSHKGPVKDPWGFNRLGFKATGEINRKDFKMTFNKVMDNGGLVVGNKVKILINGEAVNKPTNSKTN